MTAKRFTFEIKTQGNKAYTQWYDNGKLINSAETLCGLLNGLHEEVQSQSIVIKGYQDRNEILNQQICDKNKILLKEIEINENLHDENNRIKQTIQDMMETERTELGKSVLKQLYEAIQ